MTTIMRASAIQIVVGQTVFEVTHPESAYPSQATTWDFSSHARGCTASQSGTSIMTALKTRPRASVAITPGTSLAWVSASPDGFFASR